MCNSKLRQGNVFTPVCHSVHRGSLSRGSLPTESLSGGDLCIGGLGVYVQGVSVQGFSVQGVSFRGISVGWGSLSGGVCVWGVSVQGGLCQGDPPPVWWHVGGTHPTGRHSCLIIISVFHAKRAPATFILFGRITHFGFETLCKPSFWEKRQKYFKIDIEEACCIAVNQLTILQIPTPFPSVCPSMCLSIQVLSHLIWFSTTQTTFTSKYLSLHRQLMCEQKEEGFCVPKPTNVTHKNMEFRSDILFVEFQVVKWN